MDKDAYIKTSFEIINAKEFSMPIEIAAGCLITDLEMYLKSLRAAYLSSPDPRLEKLFYDKIEQLKTL